jgi:hypothetical protein
MLHMTTIAGKTVLVGDELWFDRLGLWAQVTAPGVVTINGVNNQVVKYAFTTDGYINGRKALSWHQPIVFESSQRDITKYQAVLDFMHAKFGDS